MKRLNIRNKETHLLVLFGLLALLFISVNLANNYTHQDNLMSDDKFPTSSAISINIVSPTINEYFNATKPGFIVEIDDTVNPIDTMWYTIDGGVTNITFTVNGTIDQTEWTAHAEGPVTLIFYSNNSISEEDSVSVAINKDSINPSIDSIDSPLPGAWFDSAPPSYSLSITEANLDSVWYTLDGGLNNYTGALSGTIDSTAWSNAGQGAVTIRFYANDSADNWDSASVGINRDTVNPSIDSIDSPSSGTWFNSTPPSYSLSINEVNLDSIWYTLDAGTNNYTGALSGTIDSTAWSNAGQGAVTITFYANDSVGNWDSASVGINKDSADPSIDSIDSPSSGAWFDSVPPGYSLSITEVNLDSIWYTLDAGTNNYTGALSGTIDSTAWSNAGQGAVTITFYVNDSSGNWDSASVGINRDTINPSINSIDSPLPNSNHSIPPSYSLSITEVNLDSIWYTLDAGINNYTGALSGTIDSTAWSNAGQGAVTITFYVNDSVGNWDSASVGINRDTVNPSIDSIDSPLPGAWFDSVPPGYSISITEVNLDSIWYTLDGGLNNYTGALSGTIDSTAWSNAGQGAVTITFYVNDSVGNWDSASVGINRDTVNPSIDSIDSPLPGAWFDSVPPGYSISITEVNLDSIWYTLDGGLNNYTGALSGTIDSTAWSNAGQGAVTITFYANDSAGNWDSASVGINKDSADPSIDSIDSPSSGAWFDSVPPGYSLSITEANLDSIWYTLDAGINNYTGALSGTIDSTAWSNAGQGAVTITFYVNDSVGNWDSASVGINRDTVNPSIDSIDSPLPGAWFDSVPPGYSISITEVNLDSIWYTLDGGLNNYTGALSGTIDSTAWSNAGQGAVTITFYANDSAGNWDSASVGINKDSADPSIDSIDSPSSGAWFDSVPPSYSLSITEANLDSIWYTLDAGINNYTGALSGTIDSTAWSNAGQGAVTIIFYVNDSSGNWDSASVGINRDTVNPSINSIDSPLPNSNHSIPPSYSLSITEVNLDSIWYTLDGGLTNYTGAASGTLNSTAWSNAGQGVVTITFYVNDSAGNLNSMNVNVNRDSVDPSIDSIDLPSPGTWFNSAPPSYSLSITEVNLDSIWYTLDGGLNNYTGVASGTIDSTAWNNAGQGALTIIFYVNDSAGNFGFNQVIVNKDTTAPLIDIISPLPGQTFGVMAPSFIVEIDDDTLDTMWYTIDGGAANFTFLVNGTIDPIEWSFLVNGPLTLTFYANDSFGLVSSTSVNFNKNANAPLINIVLPTLASNHGTTSPNFVVEITDTDLDTMWYTIDGGLTNITFITNETIDSTEWTAHSDGAVTLMFYANDTAGNYAFAFVLINKDTVAPTVNIISPTLLQLLGVNSPNYFVEIDDPILDTMWYSLDGGLTNYTFLTNGTFNQLAWDSVSNGTVTINFYANDLAGNEAFDSIAVRVDKITPTITVNLPVDDDIIGTQPDINITVNDVNVDSIWYRVGSTVIALPLSANNTDQPLNILLWNALPEGPFTIEFFANDTAGNLNSLYVNLVKDISYPIVIIVHPLANTTYTNAPQITLTINDATLDTTWYTIVGTNYTFEFTHVPGTNIVNINQAAWNALSNGDITFVFNANDSLGRISSDSITLDRNVPEPFDFIAFLFGPVGLTIMGVAVAIIVIVIVLKRRKTHKTSDKEVRKIESLWD